MNWLEIFKEKGAFLEGHFLLSSGLHSPNYLQCALILQYPDLSEKIAKEIAEKIPKDLKIDVVVGPALGGIIISYELARALKVRGIFAERE
ncbi:MAG: orotate phosphoribosyltransferase, partial [Dictyoglomus turgidum]